MRNNSRTDIRPDGRQLYPLYSKLTDAGANALAAYLKSVMPIRHAPPANIGANAKLVAPYLTVVVPQ